MLPNQETIKPLQKEGYYIPSNAIIEQVTIFAGKGESHNKEFRDAKIYNTQYNLPDSEVKNWYRTAGLVIGNSRVFDVHSVVHTSLGIVDMKIKSHTSREEYEKNHKREKRKRNRKKENK